MKPVTPEIPLDQPCLLAGAPEGFDAFVLAALAREAHGAKKAPLLHIATSDARAVTLKETLAFFDPGVEVILFPAWDCLPYDRASPRAEILAARMAALHILSKGKLSAPRIVIATVGAALQRLPAPEWIAENAFEIAKGKELDLDTLIEYLSRHGYLRTGQVAEPGDYAVRGGLVDLYPPGAAEPCRIDLFGEEVESIRIFDPLSQRTTGKADRLLLLPAREFTLDDAAIARFRRGYMEAFGPAGGDDPLYAAVTAGRAHPGAEHWLPLFHERLSTLFDYFPDATLSLDHRARDASLARLDATGEAFAARKEALNAPDQWSTPYQPLPPEALYLTAAEWESRIEQLSPKTVSPFAAAGAERAASFGAKAGHNFIPEREQKDINLFEALKGHVADLKKSGKRVLVAAASEASKTRLKEILTDHSIAPIAEIKTFKELDAKDTKATGLAVLPLEAGFVADDFALITETDILGDRLPRRALKRRPENFLREASSLSTGDLVVHVQHGIGRFAGLETVKAGGAEHDCLKLLYQGGDKLYLPVENIEMLSRYGEDGGDHLLDKLGGTGWQERHARLKKRIRDMAGKLIAIAAERSLKDGAVIAPPDGLYNEFCARFPFTETEDQLKAIEDVTEDLTAGRPMDRLICGDVGFGKTEVALRAALSAVMGGFQVAVIAPTTLLARQHFATFSERFKGLPVNIAQLSRLVPQGRAAKVREGLTKGEVDIVVGTHALLSAKVKLARLGLLVVDEEQHFGVAHKERLKALKSNVHVLTLSATPIPRTLQMALSGLREMSLIATPPVDRLAVRTYVAPFDGLVVREALLREHYRGGQSYFVAPRIADLPEMADFLKNHVPEVKFAVAHGQMPARRIEDAMTAFYEGRFDVLLSTSIIESGLDIANANTLIVHRADKFGLAQLYQLRGRVGRSKARAYAYLTTPPRKPLPEASAKRLHVLQSLDTLGAGFTLAAHDMDIRGAGNLLGEEQSGHIREVGVELYQKMLEQAVAEKRGVARDDADWSPQISIQASVLIPERFVADLGLRLGLYRRLASLESREEVDEFAAELADRFGEMPEEAKHLLAVTVIKLACREAGIEKLETGPKGVILTFRGNTFRNPEGLAQFLTSRKLAARLRPDHKLVVNMRWHSLEHQLENLRHLARTFAGIAGSS